MVSGQTNNRYTVDERTTEKRSKRTLRRKYGHGSERDSERETDRTIVSDKDRGNKIVLYVATI